MIGRLMALYALWHAFRGRHDPPPRPLRLMSRGLLLHSLREFGVQDPEKWLR